MIDPTAESLALVPATWKVYNTHMMITYDEYIDCDTSDKTDTLSLETMLSSISNKRLSDERIA